MSKKLLNKKTKKLTPEKDQYDLDLKEPFSNKFWALRGKLNTKLQYLEIRRFTKSTFAWALIILSITLIATQAAYLFQYLDNFPPEIPIFLNYLDPTKRLGSSQILYALPVMSAVVLLISSLIGYRMYNLRRHLTYLLLISSLSSITIFTLVLARHVAQYV